LARRATHRQIALAGITKTFATGIKKGKSLLLALSDARDSTRRRGNLGRAKLVNHLLGHFAKGTKFGINEYVGLAIIGPSNFQEFGDFCQWFGVVKEWPVCLALDPLPDLFG
jgi:hypothetical protein